ncbi:serine/threonine protein kinase [Streptomyces sp. LRE541]|uniref:serine/threonine-protein kinase n=1 Tax=Streptomyces sp. LRE541 TaxID=2931983 RepID=UPI00200D6C26|nr:serine/threonine-protein kinase [Streptomyces sp. LRE541]UPZ28492.1 serine/threonine protein kinase [Streptomyces sp. LRE541]
MHIAPLSPDDPSELGGYELLGRIGQGGMGQVYLGESPGGEPAAVKVIKPSIVDSETRLRFAQEVEILKTIWGARIAALLDADPEADPPWLATEYVEGLDLSRHVASHGPLDALLTASLGATLAEALATVHKQGLLHRDLKPANVLLGPNGPKVIDFGLAVFAESSVSLTAANTVVGTPSCMPPEQANGEKPLTAAVDVYALGAVLLFASTGHAPYRADNIHLLFHQVVDASIAPDLSGAPEELVPLLTAMLAHRPQDRPALDDVIRRCRALIEARGLKVAQARRRLTNFTAAPAHVLDDLLAIDRPTLPGSTARARAGAADVPAGREEPEMLAPEAAQQEPGGFRPDCQEPEPPHTPPMPPAPVPRPTDPRLLFARIDTSTPPPAGTTTDEAAVKPDRGRPSARPAPRGGTGTGGGSSAPRRSLRHSAQARITAQRLREAYAANSPF